MALLLGYFDAVRIYVAASRHQGGEMNVRFQQEYQLVYPGQRAVAPPEKVLRSAEPTRANTGHTYCASAGQAV